MIVSCKRVQVPLETWQSREANYNAKVRPWMDAYRRRRESKTSHPVYDFLFEYYQFNRKQVYNWHPCVGEILLGAEADKFLDNARFKQSNHGVYLDTKSIDLKTVSRSEWICQLIEAALNRPDRIHCYGMHEWAMMYKADNIRHQRIPLRMKPSEIDAFVSSSNIGCTHYDAFRFFTPEARPLNTFQPTADERSQNDQFGCIHFNMDLFKWCYKLYPWISSELTLACFQLAIEARELDMRASPYDLRDFGFEPIRIETAEGKLQYQTQQRLLSQQGRKLAGEFLEECCKVRSVRPYQQACTLKEFQDT